ncbi:hypothetical protein RRG08_013289 [Elysia crispata]|uniref:Uncharacterized protein n=1 Tax=Elysia crispata TaxID=231223 RepID=A0AAE1AWZ7_9GAST|nr:hypothetical protein RRG08_013289 [Elysia crispata]
MSRRTIFEPQRRTVGNVFGTIAAPRRYPPTSRNSRALRSSLNGRILGSFAFSSKLKVESNAIIDCNTIGSLVSYDGDKSKDTRAIIDCNTIGSLVSYDGDKSRDTNAILDCNTIGSLVSYDGDKSKDTRAIIDCNTIGSLVSYDGDKSKDTRAIIECNTIGSLVSYDGDKSKDTNAILDCNTIGSLMMETSLKIPTQNEFSQPTYQTHVGLIVKVLTYESCYLKN